MIEEKDEVRTMSDEAMKRFLQSSRISEEPRYRFNWLRQKWFEFCNPTMPTAQDLRSLRTFLRVSYVMIFLSSTWSYAIDRVEAALALAWIIIIFYPILEWRIKVHIREMEVKK